MIPKWAYLTASALLAFCLGCVATSTMPQQKINLFTTKTFSAPSDRELEVSTGDTIFMQGIYMEGENIEIKATIDMMIPGSMFIPFPVHLEPGLLRLTETSPRWKYYTADEGKASASFPGLGSVLAKGDTVGIRISHDGSRREWFVDNSIYNHGMNTIWHKALSEKETGEYMPKPSNRPFKIQYLSTITFDGFYGNQLHFTWEEITGTYKDSKSFTFDFINQPTLIGIKGVKFTAVKADNTKLLYQWIDFKIEIQQKDRPTLARIIHRPSAPNLALNPDAASASPRPARRPAIGSAG